MKKSTLVTSISTLFAVTAFGVGCGGSNPVSTATPITITGPVANQKAVAGDTVLVTWTQSVASPKLSYNYADGTGWQQFASVIAVDNNSAKAVLPTVSFSDSFQIKIEDNAGKYSAGVSAPFSVKYIVITSPAAGATLTNGSTVNITWKYTPGKVSSLLLKLSTDGGKSYGVMLTVSVDPSLKSYAWVIGNEDGTGAPFSYPSTTCILKISDYVSSQYFDATGTFSVQ